MSNIPQINIKVGTQGGQVTGNQANTNVAITPGQYQADSSIFNNALSQKMEGDIKLTQIENQAFSQIPEAVMKARQMSAVEAENCRKAKEAADKAAKDQLELQGKTNAAKYYAIKKQTLDPTLPSEEKEKYNTLLRGLEVDALLYGTEAQRKNYEDEEKDTLTKAAIPFINKLTPKLQSEFTTGGITAAQSFLASGRDGKRLATTADGQSVFVDDEDWTGLKSLDPRISATVYTQLAEQIKTWQSENKSAEEIKQAGQNVRKTQTEIAQIQQNLSGNKPLTPKDIIDVQNTQADNARADAQLKISEYNAETSRIAALRPPKQSITREERSVLVQQYAPEINASIVSQMQKNGTPMKYNPTVTGSSTPLLVSPPRKNWMGQVVGGDARETAKISSMSARFEPLFNQYLQTESNPDEAFNKAAKTLGVDLTKLNPSANLNLQNPDPIPSDWGVYLNRFRSKVLTDDYTRKGLQALQFEYNKIGR